MTDDQREARRKLRVLAHAELSEDVSKTCRYFGVGRASFYRWRQAYRAHGEAGLVSKRSVPHNHPNKTPMAIVEKVLHLRRKYHLGPMRIVWYLE
ncbi:helix-turn-helix domain-containing protein, partial [Alphaproteobacteria bacterium]|nr:helix-turn-helix domain-containing protein [Alphaproteobacteria bacterium]